jgi:UDP-N-acetylmuramyl tripeptide synthase
MKGQGAIRLWVTSSRDVTGPADHVTDQEQSVFSETLLANSVPFTFRETLRGALSEAVARAEAGDLVLLLGAQGMDPARDILGDMNTVPAPSHIAGV